MSFSTPQSADSRGSNSSDGVFVSPGTRRQPLSATGTPVLQSCPQNDDERERKQRRRSRAFDLQFSTESPLGIQSPASKQAETSLPSIPQLSNAQIADHYSTCIKLSTENKITTKNVFGLHLIDYMTEILKQKDSDLTNFKVAAGTLDASAKIYAVRVDAVHADVYRILGGLGRDAAPAEAESNQDTGGEKEDLDPSKKRSSKRRHLYKTIEKNLNNINISETERKCESDPMFQKTASSFDECSTAGVFLTTLHTHSYFSEVLFDSSVVPLPSSSATPEIQSSHVKVTDLKPLLLRCVEKSAICPSLSGFLFTQWNSETHSESVSALLDKFKKSDQAFDIDAETDNEYLEDRMDDDFDADFPDKTVERDIGEFSEKVERCQSAPNLSRGNQVLEQEGDIDSMCLQLSMNPSEYSYFSPRIMSMWAGPEHWRFKPRHKGQADSKKVGKRKTIKKAFEINFDEEIDFEAHFRQTPAATVLSKATLQNHIKKSKTYPTDLHYGPDRYTQLFLIPHIRVTQMRRPDHSPSHDQDDEVGEYDYNNPNDTSNFCPAVQDDDSDDDNEPVNFIGQGGMFEMTAYPTGGDEQDAGLDDGKDQGLNINTYGEANMVAEPQKVNKIEIQYAKTAKKMDMQRLKQTMWHILTEVPKTLTGEESEGTERKTPSVSTPKNLSSIMKELHQRLPPVMAKNLSAPLAFSCMLHLANEKNLDLQRLEDLSDVLVLQED
ncbi:condensin complex subunit 2 [Erythrolamprus reginae]|uniref:condensin complex subunit 2 n=1 Tax=Erythrolamprus reginae TaxID=121349 RepID=UPI00396CECC1